jgi:hypothetical protein
MAKIQAVALSKGVNTYNTVSLPAVVKSAECVLCLDTDA